MAETSGVAKRKPGRPRKIVAPAAAAAVAPSIEAAPEIVETVAAKTPAIPSPADEQSADPAEAVTSPAIESAPIPGPAATTAPISEGTNPMANVTSPSETAEKAQAMFGDASARMKTAFEKSTKMSEELVEFAKGNVEAMLTSARVAAKAGESLGQEAADYGKKSFEHATAVFKSFASVKSPTELLQLQSDYAKTSFDSAVAEASKLSEAMMKVFGDIAQPLSTRYALAAEKIKSTTL